MTADSGKPPPGGGSNAVLAAGRDRVHAEAVEPVRLADARASCRRPSADGARARCPACRFPIRRRCSPRSIPRRSSARSASCRIIEGWLAMSLNMMQMSIKTMELQKASLEAMRAGHAPASDRPQRRKKADMAITLYYGSGSPYAWRVQLALEHKAPGLRAQDAVVREPATRASRSSSRSIRAIACRRSPTATSRSTSRTPSSSISTRRIRRRAGRCSRATRAIARSCDG